MSRRIWDFHGGLHLPGHKAMSSGRPIAPGPLPKRLYLALQQHIGEAAVPLVSAGERVLKGQQIARAEGFVSAPIHAPTSGTVLAIEERPVPHPSGLDATCIVIEPDGEEEAFERRPYSDYQALNPSTLRNLIRESGIVGLGGAGFPSFIKLNPGPRTAVDTLILNGAECEPYITCDDRLMRERADEILAGAAIMNHALQARECVIAIEDNKPEAIAAMEEAVVRTAAKGIEVLPIPTRYPAGGEKQLIKVVTGKEVPSQGLPIDVGIVCHNVATAYAVHRAIEVGEPLITRVVTVTGGAVREPQNFEVLLGTPMEALAAAAGGLTTEPKKLLMGGSMMGIGLRSLDVGTVKTTNCLLAPVDDEFSERSPVRACIRCGACAEVCPVTLLPQQIYWHARAKDFDKAQDYNLFDCIECGCCAYVCPSNLPLVHYYRYAKTTIWAQEREKKAADLARQRHEFRQERKEREQAEKAARMQKKKAALKGEQKGDRSDASKKEAIQAAMERAKAKKAAQGTAPKGDDSLTAEQKEKLAAAKARHAARKAQAGDELSEEQREKIRAAKARHAARTEKETGGELTDEQKAKLAAAKARQAAKNEKAASGLSEAQLEKVRAAKARHAARKGGSDTENGGELSEAQKEKLRAARARQAARRKEEGGES